MWGVGASFWGVLGVVWTGYDNCLTRSSVVVPRAGYWKLGCRGCVWHGGVAEFDTVRFDRTVRVVYDSGMNRTPKVGEIWTISRTEYVCIVDTTDRQGRYLWNVNGDYVLWAAKGLTPPLASLPESFINVYANGTSWGHETRTKADASANAGRIAVLHLCSGGHVTIDRLDGRGELAP